ncbi:Translational repressor [Malassezia brasiliensis]|uniref:Translational repressor n=1 Tax=Malassezia brasiliensis TaxID=1821822 RepID=A0AAF0IRC1_9BASI|nr:Translational repressor [Malassezia brasiliensis]
MPDPPASDGAPSVPSMREHAERANRIASSQEQLLYAQLQQLGLDTGDDASLEPTPDALLPPPHVNEPSTWGASSWGPAGLAGASPWGPPPPPPAAAAAPRAPLASVPYHRRGASDLGGFRFPSSQPASRGVPPDGGRHARSPSSFATPLAAPASAVEQQRQAIQQQIEELQRQQQHLLRQQQLMHTPPPGAPPLGALHEHARAASAPHHRRIQSQSATSAPGSPLEAHRWPSHAPFASDARGMRANANFSFPPRRTPSDKPAGGARADGAPRSPQAAARHAGHTRHASYQLASELSPEYLIAAGGMLSGAALALAGGGASGGASGGDLADGFAEAPAHRRHPHARSASLSGVPPAAAGGDVMANLGQAQAQLAALHRSRQQAGPGTHARSASYSGARAASHGGGGSGPAGAGGGGRKALFGSYLPQSSLAPLLLAGKLVVGVLRVNKRNRSDAWVTTEVLEQDIFISGSKDRNRALEGDLVAVELLDPHEVWQTKRDKVDKKKRKEEHAAHQRTPSGAGAPSGARRLDKARDDAEVEGAQLKLIEDEEESDAAPPALAGHVVAIVERAAGQLFPGTLALLRPSSVATKEKQAQQAHAQHGAPPPDDEREAAPRPKIVWFRPSDKRVPLIAIPAEQAPADFWDEARQAQYGHTLFLACIKRWPITSLHPFGTLVDTLGPIGDLHAEREALVRSLCGALATDLPDAALKAAPAPGWCVPQGEYARCSFGATAHAGAAGAAPGACVFAVAPPGATAHLALSVEALDDGATAIGVHVADAAYFVRPHTALDREARRRAEAAALVGHTYPLLPDGVTHAAALEPGADRLAVSTVCVVSPTHEVREMRIARSVVRVATRLDEAQLATELATPSALAPAAPRLAAFAHALRARRAAAGAVELAQPALHIALRPDGYPAHAAAQPPTDAAACVHELVVHANCAAALRVAAAHPTTALLVRADAPTDKALHTLHTQLAALGAREPAQTLAALPHVLAALPAHARPVADALAAKALPAPRFFCTGMVDVSKFAHSWLPAPVYTEAAAPLAQYAQLCVQRQLLAALGAERAAEPDAEAVAKLAQLANARHRAVCVAEEQSAHLYLCALLARDGAQRHTATVMSVGEAHVDVLVAALAVEKRVHLDQLPATVAPHAPHAVSLTWDTTQTTQTLAPLTDVAVEVHADLDKSPPVLTVSLVAP